MDYKEIDFILDKIYTGREIAHKINNGNLQQGIINMKDENQNIIGIVLKGQLTNPDDNIYGDQWIIENEKLIYFLQKNKNQEFPNTETSRHNAILTNSLPLYFFETIIIKKRKHYKFKGQFITNGMSKKFPKFAVELSLLKNEGSQTLDSIKENERKEVSEILKRGKIEKPLGNKHIIIKELQVKYYQRDPNVVAYALQRAKGICEKCNSKAPFIKKYDQTPYLEVHHIIPLSVGGEDTVENVLALCPNCHREIHFGTTN